ncbi:MAG: ABC transporter permease [Clostridia bacterium]|nr:ABC transporter permease [Clostridia bacterium]
MWKYVLRRLLVMIPIIFLVIFIVFFIMNITPGDPVQMILGNDPPQQAVEDLRRELGLDQPFFVRFFNYIKNALKLDFGLSYRSRRPVFEGIWPKFPTTLLLAVLTVTVSTVLGVILGIISAVKEYSAVDVTLTFTSLIFASVPGFWLCLMLIIVFSLKLHLLPSSGVGSIRHFILPVLASAIPSAAYLARITRTQMLEVMRQEYIRTARAKGATEKRVIFKHALKNALMPIITIAGTSFAAALGGSMITERIFGLPGIGNYILTSVQAKDVPVVMGSTIFLSVIFMVMMLLVDLAYAYINPTLRSRFSRK